MIRLLSRTWCDSVNPDQTVCGQHDQNRVVILIR